MADRTRPSPEHARTHAPDYYYSSRASASSSSPGIQTSWLPSVPGAGSGSGSNSSISPTSRQLEAVQHKPQFNLPSPSAPPISPTSPLSALASARGGHGPPSSLSSAGPSSSSAFAPLPSTAIVMATSDMDEFSKVNLSGVSSVAGIKDSILSRLHIPDDDHPRFEFYLTQLGGGAEKFLTDAELWETCSRAGKGQSPITVSVREKAGLESRGDFDDELEVGSSAAHALAHDPRRRDQYRAQAAQQLTQQSQYQQQQQRAQPQRSSNASGGGGYAHSRSASSRSDLSAGAPPAGEYGEFGEPRDAYAAHPPTNMHSWSHSQRPVGAVGGLGPTVVAGPRAGSTTPTPPEQITRRPSNQQLQHPQPPMSTQQQQMQIPSRQWTAPAHAHSQLPPPPPRINTQLSQPVRTTVPPPQPQLRTFHQQPLPPTAYHHTAPIPQGQFYNLALQAGQYHPPPRTGPPPSSSQIMSHSISQGPQPRKVNVSKSVDDLRSIYPAFPSQGPPPIPGPIPESYRTAQQPPQRMAQLPGRPLNQSATSSAYPPVQARAGAYPPSNYAQPSASSYVPFDPRSMARPVPSPSQPGGQSIYPSYAQPQLNGQSRTIPFTPTYTTAPPAQTWAPGPPRRAATNETVQHQGWAGSVPGAQRVYAQPGPTHQSIPLQPGQTLQSASRRTSEDGPLHAAASTGRGPTAELMRGTDAAAPVHAQLERRRPSDAPRREPPVEVRRSKDGVRSSSEGVATTTSPSRHSPSASNSSSSSNVPRLTTTAGSATLPRDESAYGGLALAAEEHTAVSTSPPGSTRSSISAAGPLTPASGPVPAPQVRASQMYDDEFDDPVDDGTWFRPPGAPSPFTRTQGGLTVGPSSSPMGRQSSAPADQRTPGQQQEEWKTMTGTSQELEAAFAAFDVGDSEGTIMNSERTILRQDSHSIRPTPPVRRASSMSEPGAAKAGEDEFPETDEFDDDDEAGTWMAGSGRKPQMQSHLPKLVSPTSPPIGVSLRDEPSSRSPVTNRVKNERPNLRLRIEGPGSSESNSPVPTARQALPSPGAAANGTRRKDRLLASSRHVDTDGSAGASPSPVFRRSSFAAREARENDWAPRPPVETVLENLDDFFPESLLDQPVFDVPTPSTSTAPADSLGLTPVEQEPDPDVPLVHPMRAAGGAGLGYKKSIRVVAQGGRQHLRNRGPPSVKMNGSLGNALLRRKSTKLFGARIEEVTSARMSQFASSGPLREDTVDPANFSYQWIKGDEIGRGTFGRVYIGFEVKTRQTIAVKQVEMPRTRFDKEDARGQAMIAALKSEIELLKDLDHPHIVLYIGMEQTLEHLSIFLEYVPGGSVGRIVRTHGKFEESVISFFAWQILDGLEYLHDKKILHRDLKADNILTDQDGMCKISDFGTSKRSASAYQNDVEMSMQGTIFWMAPEVVHNEKTGYSAKADIWSLGCICLEMWAGCRPWSDSEAVAAMIKLGAQRRAPPIPEGVHPSAPGKRFLDLCLSIEAADRPRAAELKQNEFLRLPERWSFTDTALYKDIRQYEREREARQRRHVNMTAP